MNKKVYVEIEWTSPTDETPAFVKLDHKKFTHWANNEKSGDYGWSEWSFTEVIEDVCAESVKSWKVVDKSAVNGYIFTLEDEISDNAYGII